MKRPVIIGLDVLTPDGKGSILSLHNKKVIVSLNEIQPNQEMKGIKRDTMHYAYNYEDVELTNESKATIFHYFGGLNDFF